MEFIFRVVLLGIFATVTIDVWAVLSNRVLKFPRTNWAMVGRWLGHIPRGILVHNSISSAPPIKHEPIIGWMFHYLIGVVYAAFYAVFVVWFLDSNSSLLSGWAFGLVTILSPWLILQPCLGLGICANKAPRPNMVRLQNFSIHSIFGLALFYGWAWGLHA